MKTKRAQRTYHKKSGRSFKQTQLDLLKTLLIPSVLRWVGFLLNILRSVDSVSCALRLGLQSAIGVLLFGLRRWAVLVAALVILSAPIVANTTVNAVEFSEMNFQARILAIEGNLVPDGDYHIEFKLYNVASGGTAVWTETRTTGSLVSVKNGYISVNLGSVTAFSGAIDWSQEKWLTMNIGGTNGSANWDGEMNPRIKLTAVPYAFNAAELDGRSSDEFVQLDPGASPQPVNTSNAVISIDQDGAGDLLDLQSSGSQVLGLSASGDLELAGDIVVLGGNVTAGDASSVGQLIISDGSSNTVTIDVNPLAANYSISIPSIAADDEFCLKTAANCGGTSLFTDDAGFTYLTDTVEDLVIGGNSPATAGIQLQADGDADFAGHVAIGDDASINATYDLYVAETRDSSLGTSDLTRIEYTRDGDHGSSGSYGSGLAIITTNEATGTGGNGLNGVHVGASTADDSDSQSVVAYNADLEVHDVDDVAYGVYVYDDLADASTAGSLYGAFLSVNDADTNDTGLFIADTYSAALGDTDYNIHSAGSLSDNYFEGNVIIDEDLRVSDGSSNYATIDVDPLAANYSISIPTVAADDEFCLKATANCGASSTSTAAQGGMTASTWHRVATSTASNGRFGARIVVSAIGGDGTPSQSVFYASKSWTSTGASISLVSQTGAFEFDKIRVSTNSGNTEAYVDIMATGGVSADNMHVTVIPEEASVIGAVTAQAFTAPSGTDVTITTLDVDSNAFFGFASDYTSDTFYKVDDTNITYKGSGINIGSTTNAGSLIISDGSSNTATIDVDPLGANYSISIPTIAADDEFCLKTAANCGGTSLFTDDTGFTYLTDTTEDLIIGGATVATADILLNDTGSATFNSQKNAVDFRVKGDNDTDLFVVNGADDSVGIGTTSVVNLGASFSVQNTFSTAGSYDVGSEFRGTFSGSASTSDYGSVIDIRVDNDRTGSNNVNGIFVSGEAANDSSGQEVVAYNGQTDVHDPADNGYIFKAEDGINSTAGTQYGLYVSFDNTAVNNYGVYEASSDLTTVNYFKNNVGIGDVTPDAKLDVEEAAGTVAVFNRTGNDGTIIDLQQNGTSEGSISVSGATVSFNGFTGSHFGYSQDESFTRGQLVSFNDQNERYHNNPDSEILYGISTTTLENDPKVLGSYLGVLEPSDLHSIDNPHQVMAVGNGEMWVVSQGQDIKTGDYLISSSTPGHAMLDMRDSPVSYVIARAAEPVDWSRVTEETGGKKHSLISVTFEVFERDNIAAMLQTGESGAINTELLTANSDVVVSNVEVLGNLNISGLASSGELAVVGQTTTETLVVTSSATVKHSLTVEGSAFFVDIHVAGHIVSEGEVPGVAEQSHTTVTINGTDTAGDLSIKLSDATPTSSEQTEALVAKITFAELYNNAPAVNLTPANIGAALADYYVEAQNSGFEIYLVNELSPEIVLDFNYQVIQ